MEQLVTHQMYIGLHLRARAEAHIAFRLAEELDSRVRAKGRAPWQRFDCAGTGGSELGAEEAMQ